MKNYTVVDIYREFLTSIRKDYIGTVTPEQFNAAMKEGWAILCNFIANEISVDFSYKEYIAQLSEVYGEEYDDGRYLIVNSSHTKTQHGGARVANGHFIVSNPLYENLDNNNGTGNLATNWVLLPSLDGNGTQQGKYYQASLKINSIYLRYDDSLRLVRCNPLTSDRRDVIYNSFTKPNERKSYYMVNGALLDIFVPETVNELKVYIKSVKRPFIPFFDRSNPGDATYPYAYSNNLLPYANNYGSINPRIPHSLLPLLIGYGVKSYLTYINQVKI